MPNCKHSIASSLDIDLPLGETRLRMSFSALGTANSLNSVFENGMVRPCKDPDLFLTGLD